MSTGGVSRLIVHEMRAYESEIDDGPAAQVVDEFPAGEVENEVEASVDAKCYANEDVARLYL